MGNVMTVANRTENVRHSLKNSHIKRDVIRPAYKEANWSTGSGHCPPLRLGIRRSEEDYLHAKLRRCSV